MTTHRELAAQHLIVVNELLFILRGVRQGQIKSKPIIDLSDEEATEITPISLEEHILQAIQKANITVE